MTTTTKTRQPHSPPLPLPPAIVIPDMKFPFEEVCLVSQSCGDFDVIFPLVLHIVFLFNKLERSLPDSVQDWSEDGIENRSN